MRKHFILGLLLIVALALVSCGPKKTVKAITAEEATVDAEWSQADLNMVANKMSQSISESAFLKNTPAAKQAAWILANEMANDTDEHINTRVIMEKIRNKLINNVGITFVDDQALEDILKQQQLQQSDLFDNTKAARVGKLIGAKIIIRGRISSIRKRDERTDIIFYNITLQAVGLETGKILWSDEVEIGRKATKSKLR